MTQNDYEAQKKITEEFFDKSKSLSVRMRWASSEAIKNGRLGAISSSIIKEADIRIKELEAKLDSSADALSAIILDCPYHGPDDWCGKDICPCKTAMDELERIYN